MDIQFTGTDLLIAEKYQAPLRRYDRDGNSSTRRKRGTAMSWIATATAATR